MNFFYNRDWVLKYYELGFSIFPIKHFKKTPPYGIKWGKYQEKRASINQIMRWLAKGLFENIAVICGNVSGGLVCFDFDSSILFKQLDLDIELLKGLGAWVIETPREDRGYHIYFTSKKPIDFTVIKNIEGLEIRGNKHYVLLPPSIHPNNYHYEFLNKFRLNDLKRPCEIDIDAFYDNFILNKLSKNDFL
jgi:hypothetical protein